MRTFVLKKAFHVGAAVFLCFACFGVVAGCTSDNTTSDDDATKKVDPQPIAQKETYTVEFYQDDTIIGSGTVEEGQAVSEPNLTIPEDQKAYVTIIGWDCNNDGVAESFPYTPTGNVVFKLLYEVAGQDEPEPTPTPDPTPTPAPTVNTYTLTMYYDGMKYTETFEENAPITFLKYWGITAPEGKAITWYTDATHLNASTYSRMPSNDLTLYGIAETIDTGSGEVITVSSKEELLAKFTPLVINRVAGQEFKLNYTPDDVDTVVNYLIENAPSLFNYGVSASLDGHNLALKMTYQPIATKKSSTVSYTQLASANTLTYPMTRDANYNGFATESRANTFTVNNSEALYYAIENGYRPVIESGNTELNNLYNEMKTVLRQIVSSSMTDIEKVRRIYEYLIINVTYDNALLGRITAKEENLAAYDSFYLEGVFIDQLAVCDGISKAFTCLCNMEGIDCVRVTGKTVSGVDHAWNKVKINGVWYVVDATSGGTISGSSELLTYAYFLLSDAEYASYAVSDGKFHSDVVANNTYDAYGYLTSNIGGTAYSLKVTNATDGAKLFKAFLASFSGTKTLDFELAISGKTAKEALDDIMNAAEYVGSINYVMNMGSSCTLVITK